MEAYAVNSNNTLGILANPSRILAKRLSFAALVTLGVSLGGLTPPAAAQEAPATTAFRNPVVAGDFADPSIIRVGDVYYATGTSSEWAPHYPIYTSKDLVNWEPIGHVFDKMPEWTSGSFWAPELFHHKDTFYVYYTARRKSDKVSVIGVATSKDPSKGFTDHGIILEWGSEAIDGFVFPDADGKFYFSWKAYGLDKGREVSLICSEMNDDLLSLKGKPFELLQAGGKPISAEGQVMTRRGDWYYLFYSPKGCCGRGCDYQLEVARAKELTGPWELSPHNPILAGGDEWTCPGHGTLVTLPDKRDYFLYHAYNKKENVYTGRQGLLGEIAWPEDAWPIFAAGRTPATTGTSPFGKPQATSPSNFTDTFDAPARKVSWEWDLQRAPLTRIENGQLHLTIPDVPSPSPAGTFFGVRVQSGNYTATAVIDHTGPAREGLAVYGEAQSVLSLRVGDGNLIVEKVEKGQATQLASTPAPGNGDGNGKDKLHLRMTVREGHKFRFQFSTDGNDWKPVGDQEIDGAFLPPWDRAPRAGLITSGKPGDTGKFESFEIRY